MKSLLPVLALVLVASVVVGGEKVSAPPDVVYAPEARAPVQHAAFEALHLLKQQRQREPGAITDLFSPPAAPAAPAAAPPAPPRVAMAPQPPPRPAAPPLPFKYLGRLDGPQQTIVYLLRNQDMLIAAEGEQLDQDYRVERIVERAVHLTYLPLATEQVLIIPAAR
jgi:hypothetical protein